VMKVLIIDDSQDALALAKVRLAKEGLEVIGAEGGRAGLESAARERPDLILLDIDMPDLSGFEVCRMLKADGELALIPIIFLSGSGGPEDKVAGLDLGAVDYVTKPFDAFELRARVNAALRTKRLQDLLIERAKVDPLTGLANRLGMMERLQQEWARVQRHGGALSFIMCDVDRFKRVNDTYGHAAGDRALCAVAEAIAGQCRATDLCCRYGGEEFAITVPGVPAREAARLAERCRGGVQQARLDVGSGVVCVTASFGVADTSEAASPEELVQRADAALLRAKAAGRNRVEVDCSE
jgi:two-component system, cell cycle response regulator